MSTDELVPTSAHAHLSNALQRPQSKEPVWAQFSSWSGEHGEDSCAKNAQAQKEAPAVVTWEVAPRDLCA